MTIIDLDIERDAAQDMFDRADVARYQCPSCKFEYTRSRMIRKCAEADQCGSEYFCPHCSALVMAEYIEMP